MEQTVKNAKPATFRVIYEKAPIPEEEECNDDPSQEPSEGSPR
jgi:hypothetical protein